MAHYLVFYLVHCLAHYLVCYLVHYLVYYLAHYQSPEVFNKLTSVNSHGKTNDPVSFTGAKSCSRSRTPSTGNDSLLFACESLFDITLICVCVCSQLSSNLENTKFQLPRKFLCAKSADRPFLSLLLEKVKLLMQYPRIMAHFFAWLFHITLSSTSISTLNLLSF